MLGSLVRNSASFFFIFQSHSTKFKEHFINLKVRVIVAASLKLTFFDHQQNQYYNEVFDQIVTSSQTKPY